MMFIKEVSERGQLPATTGNEACSCGKMAEACICNSTEPHTIEVLQQPLCHAQPDTSTLSKAAASFKAAEGQALPMTDKCLCVEGSVGLCICVCLLRGGQRLAGVFLSLFSLLFETTSQSLCSSLIQLGGLASELLETVFS